MRFNLLLLIVYLSAAAGLTAQIIATPSDTTVCPDTEVFLHADFDPCLLTSCYFGEDIPFDWVTDPGTAISLDDNDHAGPFSIGFDFCFFGEIFNQFYVCDNGWISFSPPTNAWSNNLFPNGPIPDAATTAPKNAIFASWRDLWATGGTSVVSYFTTGIPGYRKTYIKFAEMEHPYCDDGIISYFEIALHEVENYIDNIFFQVELCDGIEELSTLGIQNSDGSIAFTAPGKNYTEWDALAESYRWKPNNIRWVIDGDTIAEGPDMSFFPAVSTDVIAMVVGCDGTTFSDTVHIHVPDYFEPAVEVTDNLCYGDSEGSINTTFPAGASGFELNWSNGETTEDISGLEAGYYILTISDDIGCSNEFSIYVDEPPSLVISPTGISDETCPGAADGSVTINAFGGVLPYSYSFGGSEFSDINFYDELPAGDYPAIVVDANGCSFETIITIGEGTSFSTSTTSISPIYEGQSTLITVTADGDIESVVWEPAGMIDPCADDPCTEITATLTETTTFTASIYSETGCVSIETIIIEVLPINGLAFPTAFSPNSDGTNDFFQTVSSYYISDFRLSIINRYGQVVYQTDDPAFEKGWDGTFENEPQPLGTYIWQVSVTFENLITWNGSGNFVLVR